MGPQINWEATAQRPVALIMVDFDRPGGGTMFAKRDFDGRLCGCRGLHIAASPLHDRLVASVVADMRSKGLEIIDERTAAAAAKMPAPVAGREGAAASREIEAEM